MIAPFTHKGAEIRKLEAGTPCPVLVLTFASLIPMKPAVDTTKFFSKSQNCLGRVELKGRIKSKTVNGRQVFDGEQIVAQPCSEEALTVGAYYCDFANTGL